MEQEGVTMLIKIFVLVASFCLMGLGVWLCVENETPWWITLWIPAVFGLVIASEDK